MTDADTAVALARAEMSDGWSGDAACISAETAEKLCTLITSLESEKEAMRKVVDAAQKWRASRTEYLIECEIALSAQAPLEGGTRYRAHAAASSMAASDLVAALQALSIPSQGERQP